MGTKASNCTFIIHPDGNDLNGGAFDHDYGGTDASQDDDPIVVIDGSTITCEIIDNYTLKLVGYDVQASDVGNCLFGQAADGTTVDGDYQWHQTGPVSSVDTTNNYWVFSAQQTWGGTFATELQSGRLGGALATLGGLNDPTYPYGRVGEASVVYMKAATYTLSSSDFESGGKWQNYYTATHLCAYKTTPGDHYDNTEDRVIIDTGSTASGGTVITYTSSRIEFVTGIEVRGNDTWTSAIGGMISCANCVAKEFTGTGFSLGQDHGTCFSCRAEGCGTSGSNAGFSGAHCIECIAIDCFNGFYNASATRCVAHGGSYSFSLSSYNMAHACVADGASQYGYIGNAYSLSENCVAMNCTYGMETRGGFGPGSAFYNNTNNVNSSTNDGRYRNPLQLTAAPFTDSANYDYTVNDDSGGGAELATRSPKFGAGVSESGPQQQQSGQLKSTGGGSTTVVTPGPVQIGM